MGWAATTRFRTRNVNHAALAESHPIVFPANRYRGCRYSSNYGQNERIIFTGPKPRVATLWEWRKRNLPFHATSADIATAP